MCETTNVAIETSSGSTVTRDDLLDWFKSSAIDRCQLPVVIITSSGCLQ